MREFTQSRQFCLQFPNLGFYILDFYEDVRFSGKAIGSFLFIKLLQTADMLRYQFFQVIFARHIALPILMIT